MFCDLAVDIVSQKVRATGLRFGDWEPADYPAWAQQPQSKTKTSPFAFLLHSCAMCIALHCYSLSRIRSRLGFACLAAVCHLTVVILTIPHAHAFKTNSTLHAQPTSMSPCQQQQSTSTDPQLWLLRWRNRLVALTTPLLPSSLSLLLKVQVQATSSKNCRYEVIWQLLLGHWVPSESLTSFRFTDSSVQVGQIRNTHGHCCHKSLVAAA